jgi:hypothetical protein
MSEAFDEYRDRLLSRHENGITNVLATVGDAVFVGAIASAVVTRRVGVGVVGATAGVALAVVAHLFQPGTVRTEISEVLRHPVWALRAEGQRIFGRRA